MFDGNSDLEVQHTACMQKVVSKVLVVFVARPMAIKAMVANWLALARLAGQAGSAWLVGCLWQGGFLCLLSLCLAFWCSKLK